MNIYLIITLFIIVFGIILLFLLKNNSLPDESGSSGCYNNCNNNGKCNSGVCTCDTGYTGNYCDIKCPDQCKPPGGICDYKGECKCNDGYSGPNCSQQNCPNECNNPNGGYCKDGLCICNNGYSGTDCSTRICPPCNTTGGTCNFEKITCDCKDGYSGNDCSICDPPLNIDSSSGCKISFDKDIECYLTFSDIIVNNIQYFYDNNNKGKKVFLFKYVSNVRTFYCIESNNTLSITLNNNLTDPSNTILFYSTDTSNFLYLTVQLSSTQPQLPIIFDIHYNPRDQPGLDPGPIIKVGTMSFTLKFPTLICNPPFSIDDKGKGCIVSFDKTINSCYLTFSDIKYNNVPLYYDPTNITQKTFNHTLMSYPITHSQRFIYTHDHDPKYNFYFDFLNGINKPSVNGPYFYAVVGTVITKISLYMTLIPNQIELPIIFNVYFPDNNVAGTASFTLTQP